MSKGPLIVDEAKHIEVSTTNKEEQLVQHDGILQHDSSSRKWKAKEQHEDVGFSLEEFPLLNPTPTRNGFGILGSVQMEDHTMLPTDRGGTSNS